MSEKRMSERPQPTRTPKHALLRDLLVRTAVLAALWWIVAEGRAGAAAFGAVVVAITLAISFRFAPHPIGGVDLGATARFLPFFLWESLRGGFDVVRRAVHPAMPLSPGIVAYPLALKGRAARVVFVVTASLLPGTLGARLDHDGHLVRIHCLDTTLPIHGNLEAIERRIAAIFRQKPERPSKDANA